jgi:hypothetical protein
MELHIGFCAYFDINRNFNLAAYHSLLNIIIISLLMPPLLGAQAFLMGYLKENGP